MTQTDQTSVNSAPDSPTPGATAIPIDDIKIGERHRKDLGDIDALAASIEKSGLLQPIVVTKDSKLIAGYRRLEALRKLNRDCILVHVVDIKSIARGERDENVCRKDFTPSEAVAIGETLEEEERNLAKERQREAGEQRGRGAKGSGKLPEAIAGDTRDKTAAAVGMSGKTYEKAKAVVQAAEEEPAKFQDVKAKMDETGKVDGAYREMRKLMGETGSGARRSNKASEVSRLWRRTVSAITEKLRRIKLKAEIRKACKKLPDDQRIGIADQLRQLAQDFEKIAGELQECTPQGESATVAASASDT